mgnify:CR=1 FL=1|tara:strand:+ start:4597 stop:5961 length:1365 start_codon:yes stop_codon:yes gene_type:complete
MALNFDFNSLNFGGNDQASNPMMQPVDLDQLNFSEPAPQSSNFKDKVIDFGKSFLGTITELARADPDVQIGSTTSAFGGMTRPGVLDTAESGLAFQNPAKTLGLGIYNPSLSDLQSYNEEPSFGQSNAPFSFFDQASIDAEEARSLNEDELEQPEASFVLPSGEIRTIMPGQDVASAFGRERGTSTFPVDEGSVTVPSELLAETMGLTPSLQDIQNVQPPEVVPDDTFVPDGSRSFFTESAARDQRLRDSERQPGETQAERDTRLARGKTLESRGASTSGGEMTFAEASKFVPRKENYRGEKERVSTRNNRIREFMARYNSDPQKASRKAAELLNQGRIIDNNLVQAKLDNYKRTSAQKYSDVVEVAELLVTDGRLTEEQAALFIVDEMGGDIKKLFDPFIDIGGGDDGEVVTSSLGSGVYNAQQEANIKRVLEVYPNLTREQAIEEMQKQGKL